MPVWGGSFSASHYTQIQLYMYICVVGRRRRNRVELYDGTFVVCAGRSLPGLTDKLRPVCLLLPFITGHLHGHIKQPGSLRSITDLGSVSHVGAGPGRRALSRLQEKALYEIQPCMLPITGSSTLGDFDEGVNAGR